MVYMLELHIAFITSLNLYHYPCLTSCILIPDHIILIPWIWDEVRSLQLNITDFFFYRALALKLIKNCFLFYIVACASSTNIDST